MALITANQAQDMYDQAQQEKEQRIEDLIVSSGKRIEFEETLNTLIQEAAENLQTTVLFEYAHDDLTRELFVEAYRTLYAEVKENLVTSGFSLIRNRFDVEGNEGGTTRIAITLEFEF